MIPTFLALAMSWIPVASPRDASLRGLAVVSPRVIWASGTGGAWLRSEDGGRHWQSGTVAGAEKLDFRDIAAWSAREALVLASGEGQASRVYGTSDGGNHWRLLFTNPDAKGFFDAMAFRNRREGLLLGDPVDGEFVIFTTQDGGVNWQRRKTPAALPGEGAFAASGTCLTALGGDAWFVTGGGGRARVFHSEDSGENWTVAETPLVGRTASAGGFSVAFRDRRNGVLVGGDYKLPNEPRGTMARTRDGGHSWQEAAGLSGYRSGVAFGPGELIAVGTNGADLADDEGLGWVRTAVTGLNAVAIASDGQAWAVGAKGLIVRLKREPADKQAK